MKNKYFCEGSASLEAAIMMPFFIIIMMAVYGISIMFMSQQIMGHTLLQSAKSLALDPYSVQRTAGDSNSIDDMLVDLFSIFAGEHVSNENWFEESGDVGETVKQRFLAFLRESDASSSDVVDYLGIKGGVDGLDFSGSSVDMDTGILTINLKYTQEFLFNAGGLTDMERDITVKVKMFEYKKSV